jgi:membrane-associated phospholipid phosphatase
MLPAPGDADGFFYRMVRSAQDTGERPTAAFPSSHIGISLILLYLVFPYSKKIFVALLPFVILLSLATVYIQAHYLVDAIAGVISSVLVFLLSSYLFDKGLFKQSLNAV